MTARRLHLASTRSSTLVGLSLVAWAAGLTLSDGFSAPAGGYAAVGVALIVAGWIGHPDRRRLQHAMHDIAEDLDPGAVPATADAGELADEAHAPGHQHLRRVR